MTSPLTVMKSFPYFMPGSMWSVFIVSSLCDCSLSSSWWRRQKANRATPREVLVEPRFRRTRRAVAQETRDRYRGAQALERRPDRLRGALPALLRLAQVATGEPAEAANHHERVGMEFRR